MAYVAACGIAAFRIGRAKGATGRIATQAASAPLAGCDGMCRSWAAGEGLIAGPEAPGVRFVFDGEQLPAGDTPARLDLEGGEIIEVHF